MSNRTFRVVAEIMYDDEDFGHLANEAIIKHLEDAMDQATYDHKLFHIESKCFADVDTHIKFIDPVNPRPNVADTLRELVEYADAADPQLIDALQAIVCLCETDAPIPLIQEQLRTLAAQVQPQDTAMADDLRSVVDKLDD
jgi:hypothetical protein